MEAWKPIKSEFGGIQKRRQIEDQLPRRPVLRADADTRRIRSPKRQRGSIHAEKSGEKNLGLRAKKELRAVLLALGVSLIPSEVDNTSHQNVLSDNAIDTTSISENELTSRSDATQPHFVAEGDREPTALAPEDDLFFDAGEEVLTGAESIELSHSGFFNEEVRQYSMHFEPDLHHLVEYGTKITRGDPEERGRMQYVYEMLEIDSLPVTVQQELRMLTVGIGIEESRFVGDPKSGVGAIGLLQIMPGTWDELADDGMSKISLADQMKVASRFITQIHTYFEKGYKKELDIVKNRFFDGNQESFERYFLTPLIINSYNSGMGRMKNILLWFIDTYTSPESTQYVFDQTESLSGLDVFLVLSRAAYQEEVNSGYKDQSVDYTGKVYGARDIILRKIKENPALGRQLFGKQYEKIMEHYAYTLASTEFEQLG